MVLAPSQSPREWRAPPSGLDRVQQRGWGSGLYSRRSAQGWQLWTIPLKAGLIAGTDLGTAGHGDRRLPPPFGRALQGSGHPDSKGAISRLGSQWRCQSNRALAGRPMMPLTRRLATLPPWWVKLQLRKHRPGRAFGTVCSGSNLPRDSLDCWCSILDDTYCFGRLRIPAGLNLLAAGS